jgi:nucleotide-binding universal stress UspA family protein
LAYDGSPKAEEALFVATGLAGGWAVPLVVVTVVESDGATPDTLAHARSYLESHGVEAAYVEGGGPVAAEITITAEEHDCDLIVIGGYGTSPVLEMVLGSSVDEVLRTSRRPVLICR